MNKLGILGWGDSQQRDYDSLSFHSTDTLEKGTLETGALEKSALASGAVVPARVAAVDRGGITVLGALADPLAPLLIPWGAASGKASRAPGGLDAPVVGDWVLLSGEGPSVTGLLPRTSLFVRKEAGKGSAAQPVVANVDRVLIVTAVGDDLSPGRIERYVTAIAAGGATPLIVVNKVDRPHDAGEVLAAVRGAAPETDVVVASALTDGGLDALLSLLEPPMTVALVGSSGVGKTTILNRLLAGDGATGTLPTGALPTGALPTGMLPTGALARATRDVREWDDKGRHTTTRRELVVTPSGLVVIDTPGVREIGLVDASSGLSAAFPDVVGLAAECRFKDCAHAVEPGCAVRAAVESGSLPAARLARFERLVREIARNDARAGDRVAAGNQKARWKAIHKQQRARLDHERKNGMKGW